MRVVLCQINSCKWSPGDRLIECNLNSLCTSQYAGVGKNQTIGSPSEPRTRLSPPHQPDPHRVSLSVLSNPLPTYPCYFNCVLLQLKLLSVSAVWHPALPNASRLPQLHWDRFVCLFLQNCKLKCKSSNAIQNSSSQPKLHLPLLFLFLSCVKKTLPRKD